jgi:amino acid permease
MRPFARLLTVILAMVVIESVWAIACAVTNANLFLFYGGMVVASAVFFVPGLTGGLPAPARASSGAAETKR